MTRAQKGWVAAATAGILILAIAVVPAGARETQKGRWLKIRVYEKQATTPTVLVNLPMGVVSAAVKIFARSGAHASIDGDIEGGPHGRLKFDAKELDEILQELEAMAPGQVLEVDDDGERVSIWIE
jgi:hypothetical protein